MQSPFATILAVSDRVATVEVVRETVCPRCAAGKGCGAGLLGGSAKPVILQLPLPGRSALRRGDRVRLTLKPAHILKAALYVYGLPLFSVVLSLSVGWLLVGALADKSAIAFAGCGLLVGSWAGRSLLRRERCLEQFVPHIEAATAEPAS